MIAAFIRCIRDSEELRKIDALSKIIFVGHGAGGNVAGAVGLQLQQKNWFPNEKLGAVWGNLSFKN